MTDWKNRIVGQGEEDPRKIVGNPRNWRIHPLAQGRGLEGVLGEIGWIAPVTINRTTGYCLDGHLRVALAVKRGAKSVPVQYVELNEAEEALALATLDPLSAMAETDADKLGELLEQIQTDDAAVEALLAGVAERAGIEADEDIPEDPGPQVDRAEELQEKWRVQRGQVWQIGKHRLMCGDSTNAEDVGKLMGGEKAALVWTDPPYGVSYGEKNRYLQSIGRANRLLDDIEGDQAQPEDVYKLVVAALTAFASHCSPGAVLYAAAPPGPLHIRFIQAMNDSGFEYRHQLIWLKNQLVFGRSDYMYKHEPILYGWLQNGAHYFEPVTNNCTVFEFDRPRASKLHPTEKPVELVAAMIQNSSRRDEIVAEPFGGSGTDWCAAEQTGRICYGMEIEPKYCAVTLERLALMGLEPRLCNA